MASRPLRFVQAGDFNLHQPPRGLAEVPEHWAARLIEAPYRAASRVFDAALAAEVDFVLLTGSLCDPRRAGPRGLVFLRDQFARLAERGIAVYWAADAIDGRGDWPSHLHWPDGVHVFAASRVEHRTHHRDGKPLCQIAGYGIDEPSTAPRLPAAAFAPNPDDLFSIGLMSGALWFETDDLAAVGNNYWAFGGSPRAATTLAEFDPPCVAHCAGTPQGRSPHDIEPSGCTLVEVADDAIAASENQIHLSSIATDVVRWHDERILAPPPDGQPQSAPSELATAALERCLHERMRALIAAAADRALLVRWHVDDPSFAGARETGLASELLSMLRGEYGFRETPAWSVSLEFAAPDVPVEWFEQQTLLGEFLRRVRDLESASAEPGELDRLQLPAQINAPTAGDLAEQAACGSAASRSAVLRQTASLGAALLSSGARVGPKGANA